MIMKRTLLIFVLLVLGVNAGLWDRFKEWLEGGEEDDEEDGPSFGKLPKEGMPKIEPEEP